MLPFLIAIHQKIFNCAQYLPHNWLSIVDVIYTKVGKRS